MCLLAERATHFIFKIWIFLLFQFFRNISKYIGSYEYPCYDSHTATEAGYFPFYVHIVKNLAQKIEINTVFLYVVGGTDGRSLSTDNSRT